MVQRLGRGTGRSCRAGTYLAVVCYLSIGFSAGTIRTADTVQTTDTLETKESPFDYTPYESVLSTFVDGRGLVDYNGLEAQSDSLDVFVKQLGEVSLSRFATWDTSAQVAFFINAYNALALHIIKERYPIRPSPWGIFMYPRNSIRQIPFVFQRVEYEVIGETMTLDETEHRILRVDYQEPRIHMALVCAAMSCPPLRQKPYRGAVLDSRLDEQTRRFLVQPDNFRIDLHVAVVEKGENLNHRHGASYVADAEVGDLVHCEASYFNSSALELAQLFGSHAISLVLFSF